MKLRSKRFLQRLECNSGSLKIGEVDMIEAFLRHEPNLPSDLKQLLDILSPMVELAFSEV